MKRKMGGIPPAASEVSVITARRISRAVISSALHEVDEDAQHVQLLRQNVLHEAARKRRNVTVSNGAGDDDSQA